MQEALRVPIDDKIKAYSVVNDDGCWVWQRKIDRYGYGHTNVSGRDMLAHRAAYEAFVGPIPEGLTIDHLCRNRACVNPAHLEPVTNRENIRRGNCRAAQFASRSHCSRGHPYNEQNSYRNRHGHRICRLCRRVLYYKYRA